MPTEISVATGGYEKRGSLWAWAIVVNKDNPLNEISMDQLERTFGSERTGGWELVNGNWMYSAKYARSAETNIRTWDQLGLGSDFTGKEIKTFGYCAPGFEIALERVWFHWSDKWNSNFMQYVEAKQGSPGPGGDAVASERPLEMLSKDKYAIGIAAVMHVKDYPNVKVLKIIPRSGGAAVALTPDNVANRTYPLIRDGYFYVNKAPGQPLDPKVREFMRFVLSREGRLDALTVRVEARPDCAPERRPSAAAEVIEAVKANVGVTIDVEVIDPDTLERSLGKLQRVIDRRS